MRYFSCKFGCSVEACDGYNWELLSAKSREDQLKRPFKVKEFDFSDLESATDGFSAGNLLGRGSYGNVYRAKLNRIKTVAAVKMTKEAHPSTAAADNEVEILSGIYHPRLVNMIGYAVDSDRRKLIVVEYMPNGTLHDLLHRSEKPPGWSRRTRFALQVAKAVQFLHSSKPPVIHRDIKSSNVLIDARFNSRISDFGLALRGGCEDVKAKSTPPAGTIGYLDPGYIAPEDLSTKSDVFSFGILLLEIISGRNAMDINFSPPSVVDWAVPEIKSGNIARICDPRIGPPDDAQVLRRMAFISLRCVRSTAARRPAMAEVVDCLEEIYGRLRRQAPSCVNLGRHVVEEPHVLKYEPLDDIMSGKLSTATSTSSRNDVAKSKSTEIKSKPLDGNDGLILETATTELESGIRTVGLDVNEMSSRRLEQSTLLVDKGENVNE